MKKNPIFLAVALMFAPPLWAQENPDRSDEYVNRIEVLRLRAQLASNPAKPETVYMSSKAQGWLDYALDEHYDKEEAEVADHAMQQAEKLVLAAENGSPEPMMEGDAPKSLRIRDDLWQRLNTYKKSAGAPCAAPYLGRLEVQLIWAGHELNELGPRHARLYIDEAERLAQEAEQAVAQCAPKVVETPPPAPVAPVILAIAKLPSEVHFAGFSAEISPLTDAVLRQVADTLNTYPWLKLELHGHTSGRVGESYNMKLSLRRVENVKARLIQLGLTEERFTTRAFGMAKLKMNSRSADAMAHNRRVEFVIVNGQEEGKTAEIHVEEQDKDLQFGNSVPGKNLLNQDQQ